MNEGTGASLPLPVLLNGLTILHTDITVLPLNNVSVILNLSIISVIYGFSFLSCMSEYKWNTCLPSMTFSPARTPLEEKGKFAGIINTANITSTLMQHFHSSTMASLRTMWRLWGPLVLASCPAEPSFRATELCFVTLVLMEANNMGIHNRTD